MKFITLELMTGKRLAINIQNINAMSESYLNNGSTIDMVGGGMYNVKESVDEIRKLIAELNR